MGWNRMHRILLLVGFLAFVLQPALAQTTLSDTVVFSFGDNGGVVLTPTPGPMLNVGYVKVQTTAASPTLGMTEILGFQSNGVLVNETVLPAAPLVSAGRLYVRIGLQVFTGGVFANPNNQSVTVSYFFTDQNGVDASPGFFVIGANSQSALFFNQAPFSGAPAAGTLTFGSTGPISVIGLHSFLNERGEFLLKPLPATQIPSSSTAALTIPEWANGGGFSTRVALINPTDFTITGAVQFLQPSGLVATVTVNGSTGTLFPYSIPPRASLDLVMTGETFQLGSVRITPDQDSFSPTAMSILAIKPSTITQSEMVIPAAPALAASRMYVENGANPVTGVIVANPSATPADATFTLTTLSGSVIGSSQPISIPGNGQIANLLSQLFPSLPSTLQGILRVSTSAVAGVVTAGLRARVNERGEQLASGIAAISETGPPDSIHPHIVVGAGWNSQLALFSRAPGAANSGTLKFISQSGAPMFIIDVTPPTVTVTSPGNSETVTGTINVNADASDDIGVAGVQFELDGSPLGAEVTAAPYSVSWNSSSTTDGNHTLTAVGRDAAGNQTTSAGVTVIVNNNVKRVRAQITSQ
jgi:hypothetical protein